MTLIKDAVSFGSEVSTIGDPLRNVPIMAAVARRKPQKCSICNHTFDNKKELGSHKIGVHGHTKEQLGWGLSSGWNRSLAQEQAFGTKTPRHGDPDFMRLLNQPEMLERKKITRNHHEDMVLRKELELRAQGFRTFCTSNYMRHKRVPDIIAIGPDGNVIAVELKSMHRYKDSIEFLRKTHTTLLLEEGFFDEVIVQGFVRPKFDEQHSYT